MSVSHNAYRMEVEDEDEEDDDDDDDDDEGDPDASVVEVSLAGLVQVLGAGLRGAQQVEAPQGVAGQRLGALGGVTRALLQEAGAGGERRNVAG